MYIISLRSNFIRPLYSSTDPSVLTSCLPTGDCMRLIALHHFVKFLAQTANDSLLQP